MKIKKFVPAACLALSIFGIGTMSASADVLGGWSEDQGYFTNVTSDTVYSTEVNASYAPTPTKHTSTFYYNTNSSVLYEAVGADTIWPGAYHYSRARYESTIGSGVYSDSERVYGQDKSFARSAWRDRFMDVAKTYYGI